MPPQPYKEPPSPSLLALHNSGDHGCTPCHKGDRGRQLYRSDRDGDGDPYWENPLLKGIDVGVMYDVP